MSRFLRVKNHSLNASGYSGDNDNLHGSLRTRIISSRVGKHTADFLERKLSAVASKYLKGPCKQARPEIIIQQLLHDSSDTASTYSGSTITTWRGSLNTEDAARILPTISPNEVQYQELMFELMVTEEGYFTDLRNLMEDFAIAILNWEHLPTCLRVVLEGISDIAKLHGSLLGELQETDAKNGRIIIDAIDLFERYIPHFFNIYKDYFLNFEPANNLIAATLEDPHDATKRELRDFILERMSEPKYRSLTLQAFLLKPVQRLMKYPLFLKSLIDTLPPMSDEYYRHMECMNNLDGEIRRFEEHKSHMEHLIEIQHRTKGLEEYAFGLADTNRYLVHQGWLTLVPGTRSTIQGKLVYSFDQLATYLKSQTNQVYVFLFNDLILFTKIRSKRLSDIEISKPNSTIGPHPATLFKLVLPPCQLTYLDRCVKAKVSSSKPSLLNKSVRFRSNVFSSSSHITPSRSYHEHAMNGQDEIEPLQFMCAVAHKNVTNLCLEASSISEKEYWCNQLQSVWDQHCKR
ncbi:hypothetical protein O0I10_003605 [Lichtheimia ornata]|uniref:DH domain-containing protein n=1 Tax=Lichtheimia ornata TaxID=688661 RepID=A0AAD7V726_9FUNG|nr:uncharacterized protein O0I10_003605 [Lichtheimia ornata]KAJ8660558.1 hypothetical protein O0I10_003605 [Lichtheimia ornata]